jgi:signal transduction histidine kinase
VQQPVGKAVRDSREDFPFIIASTPPNARQRRLVLVIVAVQTLGIALAIPFAGVQGPRIDAFIPVLQTVMCVADLITACLLFAQYSIQPKRALLVLASGYVCSGMFAFLQTLAFPGAYAPAGLFGSTDHAAWFFVLWHTTFPLAIIVYAFLKDASPATIGHGRSAGTTISLTIACVFAIIIGLTLLVTAGVGYLPVLYSGGITQQTLAANLVNVLMWLTGVVALVVLFFRRRSILDLWLIVTLIAWMPNFIVAALVATVRFSLGWYMARGYALIASCTVLAVLLTETTFLYARLVNAVTLLRRERVNRLMSVDAATAAMAHEIRQPLSGVTAQGGAALNWLKRVPPNVDKARECVEGMVAAVLRADEVISAVGSLTRMTSDTRTALHINDLTRQVVALMERDLQASGVAVTAEYHGNLPQVRGDRTLLQQVLLNLVKNSIEAMASVDRRERRLRVVTQLGGSSSVLLSVEDSGPGISEADRQQIFEPFFTTKPTGTGLGLSICRTIIEDHGGELRLATTESRGSVFQISLPTKSA